MLNPEKQTLSKKINFYLLFKTTPRRENVFKFNQHRHIELPTRMLICSY